MGHLINANALRLGVSKFWNFKILITKNYFNEINLVKFLGYYLENFFNSSLHLKNSGFFFSHYFFFKRVNSCHIIKVCLFSGYFQHLLKTLYAKRFFSLQKKFVHKYIRFCQNFIFVNILKKRLLVDLIKFGITDIIFVFSSESNLTAALLGRLISYKLTNLYSLNQVINPILKKYLKKKYKGLTIACSGRFTRKQRAHFLRYRSGSVSFSTLSKKIDYFFISVKLKYGACGIKIWLSD